MNYEYISKIMMNNEFIQKIKEKFYLRKVKSYLINYTDETYNSIKNIIETINNISLKNNNDYYHNEISRFCPDSKVCILNADIEISKKKQLYIDCKLIQDIINSIQLEKKKIKKTIQKLEDTKSNPISLKEKSDIQGIIDLYKEYLRDLTNYTESIRFSDLYNIKLKKESKKEGKFYYSKYIPAKIDENGNLLNYYDIYSEQDIDNRNVDLYKINEFYIDSIELFNKYYNLFFKENINKKLKEFRKTYRYNNYK